MTPTAGQQRSSLSTPSHSRPSAATNMAASPSTLQPNPSLVFPVPYLPVRTPLSPPPCRNVYVHTFSTVSSPAISPTTIPTTTDPRYMCPLVAPSSTGRTPPANPTVAANQHGMYETKCHCNNCAQSQPLSKPDAVFPWTTVAWETNSLAEGRRTSLAQSTDGHMSYASHMSHTNGSPRQGSNIPSQQQIYLERWLRQQASFHASDDFANPPGFVPFEEPRREGELPGPRQMLLSKVPAAFSDYGSAEGDMDWTKN